MYLRFAPASSNLSMLDAVPELTHSAGIQLNERVSLPIVPEILSSIAVVRIGRRRNDPATARLGVAVVFPKGGGGPAYPPRRDRREFDPGRSDGQPAVETHKNVSVSCWPLGGHCVA